MTTGFFTLRPMKGLETNHSQMTTSFLIDSRWIGIPEVSGSSLCCDYDIGENKGEGNTIYGMDFVHVFTCTSYIVRHKLYYRW